MHVCTHMSWTEFSRKKKCSRTIDPGLSVLLSFCDYPMGVGYPEKAILFFSSLTLSSLKHENVNICFPRPSLALT